MSAVVACGPNVTTEPTGADGDSGSTTEPAPPPSPPATTLPQPECRTNADCPIGEYCYSGECHEALGDADADAGPRECVVHRDCGDDRPEYCNDGLCYVAPGLSECAAPAFAIEQIPNVPGGEVVDLTYTDFDADGIPDLGVLNHSGVHVRSSAEGIWRTFNFSGGTARHLVGADFDDDGDADLLFGSRDPNGFWTLAVLMNDGALDLSPQLVFTDADEEVRNFVVGDFTGDGALDVAVSRVSHGVYIHPGDGLGGVGPHVVLESVGTDLVAIDQDRDGVDDLFGLVSGYINAAYGNQAANYEWVDLHEPERDYERVLTVGDVTGDDRPDVLSAAERTGWTLISQWGGDDLEHAGYLSAPVEPLSIAAVDVDGDALREVVVGTATSLETWSSTIDGGLIDCAASIELPISAPILATAPLAGAIAVSDGISAVTLGPPPRE